MPNAAVRNLIREDKIHQIYSSMQSGQEKFGMQTFNQSLATAYFQKQITLETAMARSSNAGRIAGNDQPWRQLDRTVRPRQEPLWHDGSGADRSTSRNRARSGK